MRDARESYKNARTKLQTLRLINSSKRIHLKIPYDPVTIEDRGAPVGRTVRSPRGLLLNLGAGTLFGIMTGLVILTLRSLASSREIHD